MKLKIDVKIFCCCFVMLTFQSSVGANTENLTASVANIPIHSEVVNGKAQGGFVEVVKLLDSAYQKGEIRFQIFPFARSIANIKNHKADFHLPLIRPSSAVENNVDFYYVEEPICQVTFVLYTLKGNKELTANNANEFSIDTHRGHQEMFTFPTGEVSSIAMGIKKLLNGRIDGFVFEQEAVDKYIKENKLTSLKRQYFATFDSSIIVPKSEKGKEISRRLSQLLKQVKQTNELTKITANIHRPYQDWQP